MSEHGQAELAHGTQGFADKTGRAYSRRVSRSGLPLERRGVELPGPFALGDRSSFGRRPALGGAAADLPCSIASGAGSAVAGVGDCSATCGGGDCIFGGAGSLSPNASVATAAVGAELAAVDVKKLRLLRSGLARDGDGVKAIVGSASLDTALDAGSPMVRAGTDVCGPPLGICSASVFKAADVAVRLAIGS